MLAPSCSLAEVPLSRAISVPVAPLTSTTTPALASVPKEALGLLKMKSPFEKKSGKFAPKRSFATAP